MSNIKFSGYEWHTGDVWGHFNPEKQWMWYDPSLVIPKAFGGLNLDCKPSPKLFEYVDPNGNKIPIEIQNGIGVIGSLDEFGPGYFEVVCVLPQGVGLWPSFWLYTKTKDVFEIDVFEGYSKNSSYKGSCFHPFNIETCFHYNINGEVKNIRGRGTYFKSPLISPHYKENTYAVYYNKTEMYFYYNEVAVRKFKNREVLARLFHNPMQVIISNGIDGKFFNTYASRYPMRVKSFRHEAIY